MNYFANIVNNIVTEVIVVAAESCNNLPFPASEPYGQAFIVSLGQSGDWLQTSITGEYRNCYAGIGYSFNPLLGEYGEFVPPVE